MIRLFKLLITSCFFLTGCASTAERHNTIHIGIAAPEHYDVWVETFELEAAANKHWRMAPGYVSCCWKGDSGPSGKGGPSGLVPHQVGIEWYSFSEDKRYYSLFSLPQNLETEMQKPARFVTGKGSLKRPRDILTFGLAPGGTIVVWIQNQIGNEVEVARYKAKEIPSTDNEFTEWTKTYQQENNKFLEKNGVPTGGW